MTLAEILPLVDNAFPCTPRPDISEFPLHEDGCGECECLLEHLAVYNGAELTMHAVQYLFGSLSTLSPKATLWLLSRYLRRLLLDPAEMDYAIERLIYTLSPEFEKDTLQRFCLFNQKQIACLVAVVDYWLRSEERGEQFPEELNCAEAFLQRRALTAKLDNS